MKQTYSFAQRRDFARAFAWHEAQTGARVTIARRAREWTVTVQDAAFPRPAFN